MQYVYLQDDPDFCRVYYVNRVTGGMYCIQDDGRLRSNRFHFYRCSRDGEPSYEIPMPAKEKFDRYLVP